MVTLHLLTRQALRCAAFALTLAALGGAAQSQAPLVPGLLAGTHHHAKAAPPSRASLPNPILSGVSYVFAPRPGSAAMRDGFLSFLGENNIPAPSGWMSVGPDSVLNASGTIGGNFNTVSGRVAAIAVDPTNNNTIYVASAGGGVWKSTDGGSSYTPTTDFLGDTAMGSIAVAPSNTSVIYAGTGEANNSGDSQYGIGLLKSTDGAATWSLIPGPSGAFYRLAISKIVVNPTNSNIVYLTTTDFANNGVGGNTGVWKTTDGGATWTNTTAAAGLDSFDPYSDLVMDPTNPNTLYAAIGNYGGANANGVYKTIDGGATWTQLTGFPSTNVGRIALALAASATGTIYASVQDSTNNGLLGLYKTTNSGTTWTQMTAAPNYLGGQGWYDNAIAVNPHNPNQVFAGGQVNYNGSRGSYYALAGSQNGGTTFQDYSLGVGDIGPHTDLHALTFTADGTKLLDGNDGGIWRLENPSAAGDINTTQWSDINANLGTIQFTGIALHPTSTTIAYGGSQDNGTEKYSGNVAWTQVRDGDGGFTRVDQSNPNTVYHEFYGISLERSDDGGNTWNGKTNGINPNDAHPPDGSDPAAFYVPYKLDPANQSRVIYGTDHIYESLNRGDSFSIIGTPGVAGFNPSDQIVSTLGVTGSTIYAAAGANLYVTTNDGTSWTDVSIPNFNGSYSDIFVNPSNANDVYVSRSNFGSGKVFHSTNSGATWTDISGNLPDEPFNAILLDAQAGVLYAGGDDGVYSSANTGASWARLDPSGDFPTVQVVDLALSVGANLIGAGTHGRGLFEIARSSNVVSTTLTVANVTGAVGQMVTLSATLTGGGAGVGGKTLSFQVDNNPALSATTNSSGMASVSYLIPANTMLGSHTISVTFAGDSADGPSSGTGTLTVIAGAAAHLAFSQQPTNTPAGATLTPAVVVQATDASNNPVAGVSVTLTLQPTSGTLSGTVTQATDSTGKATFGNLSVNAAGQYTLKATANGLTVTSATFTVTAPPAGQVRFWPRTGFTQRMVGGQFQASHDNANWTTLATVTQNPPAGQYTTLPTTQDPAPFRFLRYLAPNGSYGDVAEIEFDSNGQKLTGTGFGTPGSYHNDGTTFLNALDGNPATFFDGPGPNGDFVGIDQGGVAPTYTKLTGTVFGTAGSYHNDGTTIANAFDGSLATFFDGPGPNGDYAGLDLGSGHGSVVTRLQYCPRSGFGSRMVGGVFQGSNDNATWTALFTVTSAPAVGVLTQTTSIGSGVSYRYLRYLAPNNSYGDVAEIEFDTSP